MRVPSLPRDLSHSVEIVNCCNVGTPILLDDETGEDLLHGTSSYTNDTISAAAFITTDSCHISGSNCTKVNIALQRTDGSSVAYLDASDAPGSFTPIDFRFTNGCLDVGQVSCPRRGCDLREGWRMSDLNLACDGQAPKSGSVGVQVTFCASSCRSRPGKDPELRALPYGSSKLFDSLLSLSIIGTAVIAALFMVTAVRYICVPRKPRWRALPG